MSQGGAKDMHRQFTLQKLLRTALIFISILLSFGALGIWWLNSQSGKHFVEHLLAKRLDAHVEIDTFYLNPLWGMHLSDIVIIRQGDTVANIEKATLRTKLRSWLRRSPSIHSLILSGVHFRIHPSADTAPPNLSLTDSTSASDSTGRLKPLQLQFQLVHLAIQDLKVEIWRKNRTLQSTLSARRVEIHELPPNTGRDTLSIGEVLILEPLLTIYADKASEATTNDTFADQNVEDIYWRDLLPMWAQLGKLQLQKGRLEIYPFAHDSLKTIAGPLYGMKGVYLWEIPSFHVEELTVGPEGLHMDQCTFELTESRGLSFSDGCASGVRVSDTSLTWLDFELHLPEEGYCKIWGKARFFSLADWKKAADYLWWDTLDIDLVLPLQMLGPYHEGIARHALYRSWQHERLQMRGHLYGSFNSLRGRDLRLRIGSYLTFAGGLSTKSLLRPEEKFFNIRARSLQTHAKWVSLLVPKLPDEILRLGRIHFKGYFDGFPRDFVAYGTITSSIGKLRTDMRLNLRPGIAAAEYSGSIILEDFHLGSYLQNPLLGKVHVEASVQQGRGLTFQTAKAKLQMHIHAVDFHHYTYQNIVFAGTLDKSHMDGKLISGDPNLRMIFDGQIRHLDSIPEYDFIAQITRIRLQPLHWSKARIELEGAIEVHLSASNFDDAKGHIQCTNLRIRRDSQRVEIPYLTINQQVYRSGIKEAYFDAPQFNAKITGHFQWADLQRHMLDMLRVNHSKLFAVLGYGDPTTPIDTSKHAHFYNLYFNAKQIGPLTALLSQNKMVLDTLYASAFYREKDQSFGLEIMSPRAEILQWHIAQPHIYIEDAPKRGLFQLSIGQLQRKGAQPVLSHVFSSVRLIEHTVEASVRASHMRYMLDTFHVRAAGLVGEDSLVLQVLPGWIGTKDTVGWRCSGENSIIIKPRYLKVSNLKFLSSLNNYILDTVLRWKTTDFEGSINFSLSISDLLKWRDWRVMAYSDDLHMKPVKLGTVYLEAHAPSLQDSAYLTVLANNLPMKAKARGVVHSLLSKPHFQLQLNGQHIPASFAKILIPTGISELKGSANADLRIYGTPKEYQIEGNVHILYGGAKVDYTGVYYTVRDQRIQFYPDSIDFTGISLMDRDSNIATVVGGIAHNAFRSFNLNTRIHSPHILALATTERDNPYYYGTAIGQIDAQFSGPFQQLHIKIAGHPRQGSKIYIPTEHDVDDAEIASTDFIYFATPKGDSIRLDHPQSYTLSLDLDLTVDEASEVYIIFDYSFTFYNVFNRKFDVLDGSAILWHGDPINAQLDLIAVYDDIRAPVSPLIRDILQNAPQELQAEAAKPHPVILKMFITGTLYQPEIRFDIEIPELTGLLNNYVQLRLEEIRANTTMLNQQVFSLISFNSFLPPSGISDLSSGVDYASSLSDVFTHQISVALTRLVNRIVQRVGFISDIQIQIDQLTAQDLIPQYFLQSAYGLDVDVELFEGKARLHYRTLYSPNTIYNDQVRDHEVYLDILNMRSKGLTFNVFLKNNPIIGNEVRNRIGTGVKFYTQFDSLSYRQLFR